MEIEAASRLRPRITAGIASTLRIAMFGAALLGIALSGNANCQTLPGHPAAQPKPILETTYTNPPFNTSDGTWASKLVHGNTFMGITADSKFEWTQVLNPNDEYDQDFVGLSGWALSPDVSRTDNPYDHPFASIAARQFDWEFFIAPDKPYQALSAPTADSEYVTAAALSAQRGHPIQSPYSVLGLEIDNELVPLAYRAQDGDRICTWGRWIVDTGHPDFHSEIHPPALLVAARPILSGTNPVGTYTSIIGRPYMVGQTYTSDDFAMKDHLLNEIAKVKESKSLRIEMHPHILPKPFAGVHTMTFVVRPPIGRALAIDHLMATYQFTTRTGVAIQLTNSGDSVTAYVVMNDAQYKAPPLPARHDVNVTRAITDSLGHETDWWGLFLATIVTPGSPLAPIIELEGIPTDNYDSPATPTSAPETTIDVASLSGNSVVKVDNNQPYPIAGHLSLNWVRSPIIGNPTTGGHPVVSAPVTNPVGKSPITEHPLNPKPLAVPPGAPKS